MEFADLKRKISDANAAYRLGNPVMSDLEYDGLLESFQKRFPDEYEEFRSSLNEGQVESGQKLKHRYIMGSLDKIKNSDPDSLGKFIKKYIKTKLNISAKVDGISSVARYVDGGLKSFASRGDGYNGVSYTDKAPYVKGLPAKIDFKDEIYVRGELVVLESENVDSATNLRNVCAGWMNQKYWTADTVSKVSFIPYTILGGKYTKNEQFRILESLGFKTAWHEAVDPDTEDLCAALTEKAKLSHGYACDGLVLTDDSAYNEQDEYRPKNAMAFKINELVATTRVIDMDWSSVSKNGFICPVFVLEPVELGGSVISRASAANLDVIESLGVKYGSVVRIAKSNDIIPHVEAVLDNTDVSDIEFPEECPCCGSRLVRDGVNLRCMNAGCSEQVNKKLTLFMKKMGVEDVSNASLKKFGINSFDAVLSFRPNEKYKSETKFYRQLLDKVFSAPKEKLFYAMDFQGLSEVLLNKIVSFYGLDFIEDYAGKREGRDLSEFTSMSGKTGLPTGIGEITLGKFLNDLDEPLECLEKLTSDPRWNPAADMKPEEPVSIGSICITGSLSFGSRGAFQKMAKSYGYESRSSVSKGLTYLINNDINSNSSKNRKAKELGVKILTEKEFLALLKRDSVQEELGNL